MSLISNQSFRTKFMEGLFNAGGSYDPQKYKWVGGDKSSPIHSEYFTLCGFTKNNRPPHEDYCVCGHKIKQNCYLQNIDTGQLIVVGNDCIKQYMPDQYGKRCGLCKKTHQNKKKDQCNDCIAKQERVRKIALDEQQRIKMIALTEKMNLVKQKQIDKLALDKQLRLEQQRIETENAHIQCKEAYKQQEKELIEYNNLFILMDDFDSRINNAPTDPTIYKDLKQYFTSLAGKDLPSIVSTRVNILKDKNMLYTLKYM